MSANNSVIDLSNENNLTFEQYIDRERIKGKGTKAEPFDLTGEETAPTEYILDDFPLLTDTEVAIIQHNFQYDFENNRYLSLCINQCINDLAQIDRNVDNRFHFDYIIRKHFANNYPEVGILSDATISEMFDLYGLVIMLKAVGELDNVV